MQLIHDELVDLLEFRGNGGAYLLHGSSGGKKCQRMLGRGQRAVKRGAPLLKCCKFLFLFNK